jgi:hypothetical protein
MDGRLPQSVRDRVRRLQDATAHAEESAALFRETARLNALV